MRLAFQLKKSHHEGKPLPPLMLESIIPLDSRQRRRWGATADRDMVAFARIVKALNAINSRKEMESADASLYSALRIRERKSPGIMERVGFEEKRSHWESMKDEELVAYAKKTMRERGIRGKCELRRACCGLYQILHERKSNDPGIMEKVGFEGKYKDWASKIDDEIVGYAREFIKLKGISGQRILHKVNRSLYGALYRRKLLDRVYSEAGHSCHREAVDGVIKALGSFGDEK